MIGASASVHKRWTLGDTATLAVLSVVGVAKLLLPFAGVLGEVVRITFEVTPQATTIAPRPPDRLFDSAVAALRFFPLVAALAATGLVLRPRSPRRSWESRSSSSSTGGPTCWCGSSCRSVSWPCSHSIDDLFTETFAPDTEGAVFGAWLDDSSYEEIGRVGSLAIFSTRQPT